ncbi:MAG TPA: sigma-54 dependent transcriptional regulator [Balneolaceae bacterium]|nr:sigma-54 dependent transcriptional regulator [Balneolaceae bacterium]
MANARILVVDDEIGILEACEDTLKSIPEIEIITEQSSKNAANMLKDEQWDILITDLRMPTIDGIELIRIAQKNDPDTMILMLTAYPSVDTAVESMKLGAADYLTKPFSPESLRTKVKKILEKKQLQEENRMLRRQVKQDYHMGEMVGKCQPMQKVFDTIRRIASANIDVLILGETGTGKELAARNIHQQSSRRDENFVPVDCGAIPSDLLESEFFGHEKGAYTGASRKSMGLLEFANKGTFFLDEIGQLPLKLQAKLLRVLQERKIRRVGGKREIDIDVRIIAATSLNLEKEIEEKNFRMDLYQRINVARIKLPPLRERVGDISLLTSHIIKQQEQQMGIDENVEIEPEVLEVFKYYHWPGNIRELKNVIKRTLVMTDGNHITVDDLPENIVVAAGEFPKDGRKGFFKIRENKIEEFEKQYFKNLLDTNHGNVTKAAEQAQIPRGTFYRLLKKNNIDPTNFRIETN